MAVTIPTSKTTFEYAVKIRIVSFQNKMTPDAKTHEQASHPANDYSVDHEYVRPSRHFDDYGSGIGLRLDEPGSITLKDIVKSK